MRGGRVVAALVALGLLGCQPYESEPPGAEPEPPPLAPLFSSGFERGLEGWEVEEISPTVSVEPVASAARSGSAGLSIRGEDDSAHVILRVAEPLAVEPGRTYTFSFYYRSAPASPGAFPPAPSVRVMVFDPDGKALVSEYRRFVAGPVTDRWARFRAVIRLATAARVQPEVWLEKERGTIYVDDVTYGPLQEPTDGNLISNGGFEQGDAGVPYDWVTYNPEPWRTEDPVTLSHLWGPGAAIRWTERGARSGRRCLLLERSAEDAPGWLRARQVVSLRGGRSYLISGWVSTAGEGSALIAWQLAPSRMEPGPEGRRQVERGATDQVSGTTSWRRLETMVPVPAEAPSYALRVDVVLSGMGRARFDDIAVTPLGEVELH